MPGSSENQSTFQQVGDMADLEMAEQLVDDTQDNDNTQADEVFSNILLTMLQHGHATRYLTPHSNIPKIEGQLRSYLSDEYPEDRFRSLFRMNKRPFVQIASLIQDNAVFQNDNSHQQAPPATQLAAALFRMGQSNQSTVQSSTVLGIRAGRVDLYLERVIKVLMTSHYMDSIKWPKEAADMKRVQDEIEEGTGGRFPGCCGFLDNCLIDLAEKPAIYSRHYWTRKDCYSFNILAVCDFNLRFTYLMLGPFGRTPNSEVFESSDLYNRPGEYFPLTESGPPYLLGDEAYPNSAHQIVPFQEPAASERSNQTFNIAHARARIKIEQAFGVLKNRFESLKRLPVRINEDDDHIKAMLWVGTCVCLHNLILAFDGGDDPFLNDPALASPPPESQTEDLSSMENVRQGEMLRDSLRMRI